ncbi:MAG: hypothetical protein RMJ97_05310 [Raineya sp.]|nr:hypothetical protein [Raineya sp.]
MFKLVKIKTEQFAIIESVFDESKEEIKFGFDFKFGLSSNKEIIIVSFKPAFIQDAPFLILEVSCFFEMKNPMLKEELIIDQDTARHLLMLTIGTARGVLHAKTENTPFNKFIIPTINLYKAIEEDIKFEAKT